MAYLRFVITMHEFNYNYNIVLLEQLKTHDHKIRVVRGVCCVLAGPPDDPNFLSLNLLSFKHIY